MLFHSFLQLCHPENKYKKAWLLQLPLGRKNQQRPLLILLIFLIEPQTRLFCLVNPKTIEAIKFLYIIYQFCDQFFKKEELFSFSRKVL